MLFGFGRRCCWCSGSGGGERGGEGGGAEGEREGDTAQVRDLHGGDEGGEQVRRENVREKDEHDKRTGAVGG